MRFYKPNKGVTLPTLTEPAGPANIVLDKEAINGSGKKVVGELYIDSAFTVNRDVEIPLVTFDIADGIRGLKVAGSLGNATAADIVKGKNAFTDAGFVEGALEAPSFDITQYMYAYSMYIDNYMKDFVNINNVDNWQLLYINDKINNVDIFYNQDNFPSSINIGGYRFLTSCTSDSITITFEKQPGVNNPSDMIRQCFSAILVLYPYFF